LDLTDSSKFAIVLGLFFWKNWSGLSNEGVLASIRLCLAAMASADYDSVQRAVDRHSLRIELWNYLSAIDGNDGFGGSARLG
jgi:hypothetical protein